MKIGRRIIFDEVTGNIVCNLGEMQGDVLPRQNIKLDYIDLTFGKYSEQFKRAKKYHIDTNTKTVIFDELYPIQKTEEERLRREKQELENQLLLKENENIGGIL